MRVGLAAPGKGPKLIFLRALTTLLAAAEKEAQAGGDTEARRYAFAPPKRLIRSNT
jgi:hypothetical protein